MHRLKQTPSLKTLSKNYLHLKVDKTFQSANWRVRPLAKGMVDYGVGDAFLLLGVFYSQWILMHKMVEE